MSTRTTTAAAVKPRYVLFGWIACGALAGVLIGLALTTAGAVPGIVEPGAAVVVGLPLSRAIIDLAALTTVGMTFLPKLLGFDRPERTEQSMAMARQIALFSSVVWLVAALVSLVFETADFNPDKPLSFTMIVDYVRLIGSGQALVIVAGCALLSVVIGVLAVRNGETVPAELRITVAMFTLLPLPVTGHAANTTTSWHDLVMISMELHVVGAVAWTGGLLAVIMLLVTNRSLLADALPRYSRIATICVFTVAVTGAFNGWFELYQTPGVHWYVALFETGYGRILIGKIICITAVGLIGAHTRFKLLPAIQERKVTAVALWSTMELAVMAIAFGLAVVLVRAPVVGAN
jgi:putative copper resistance protein D